MKKEKTYSSGEVAKRILVEPVTVRKYAQMLEEKGYSFDKDQKGWRCFKETDLHAFQHLATLRQGGLSVEESVETIADLYHQNLSILPTDTSIQKEDSTLLAFMKRQEEFNKMMLERLEAQERRQAERDEKLMLVLRESQEVKQQLVAAEENKKKWWEFWK